MPSAIESQSSSVDRVQQEIRSLNLIKDSMQNEINNLHSTRVNLSNQLSQIRKEIDESGVRMRILNLRNEESRKQDEAKRENRLYNLEKNMEVLRRQISDREKVVAEREAKCVDLEQRVDLLKMEHLELEKLKIKMKKEEMVLNNRKLEVEGRVSLAKDHEENARANEKKAKEYRDQVINMEIRIQDQTKNLLFREKNLQMAQEAFEKSLSSSVQKSDSTSQSQSPTVSTTVSSQETSSKKPIQKKG